MMHKKTYLLCLFAFVLQLVNSQTTVTVQDGSTDEDSYGLVTWWYYGYNQNIYTQSDINQAGTITSIQLEADFASDAINPVKIYMSETTKSSFSSTSDWVNTGQTLVFSGSVSTSSGWFTITLDTPFEYTNTNNLLITIDNDDGTSNGGSSSTGCTYVSTGVSNVCIWQRSDSEDNDYGSTSYNGSRTDDLPSLKLTMTTETAPTVTTASVTSVTVTTATGGGEITDDGGASITTSGVCWNTSTNPTTANSKTTDGPTSQTSWSNSSITGLTAETYYYLRAYATNSEGTSYGSNVEFWTLSAEPSAHPATFTGTAHPEQIDLTFSAASTISNADGYIILQKSGATAPANTGVSDGTAPGSLAGLDGSLAATITSSATTTSSITGLSPSTQYSFTLIPYNYNGSNNETYNYKTDGTLTTVTVTTAAGPSGEGFKMSGDLVNNGTLVGTNDVNYLTMTNTKAITGSGIYTDVKLYSNGTITFNGTVSSGGFSELFVNTSKSLAVAASKTIVNTGDITNYGTFTLNSSSGFTQGGDIVNIGTITANSASTLTLNGSTGQNITSNSATWGAVTFNNTHADGITLQDEMNVAGATTWTDGHVTTTSTNILTFATTSASPTGSAASHIIGPAKKTTDATTAFLFPLGNGTNYDYLKITPSTTASTVWTSQYYASAYSDLDTKAGLNNVSTYEYWDLTRVSGTADATIEIAWDAGDAISDYTDLTIAHFDSGGGGEWEKVTSTATGTNTSGTLVTDAAFSSFSPFTKGSITGGNPLPIELLSFNGICNNNQIDLIWVTATEINNDYFLLEKSIDNNHYLPLDKIEGKENTKVVNEYQYIDNNLVHNNFYYRLSQYDHDGASEVFAPIHVACTENENHTELIAYGNKPDGYINIDIIGVLENEIYEITVLDASGRSLYYTKQNASQNKANEKVYIANQAAGIYFVQVNLKNKTFTQKVVW